jgi:peptidylprolyl isomerase
MMSKHIYKLLGVAWVCVHFACGTHKAKQAIVTAPSIEKEKSMLNVEQKTASGLVYKITEQGNGIQASKGDKITVHYTGTLTNGTKFDSSKDRNQPFSFKLGIGQVIKGWDEGIALLRVGDKAVFTIPSELGYGDREMGNIPPNSTLVFEVELLNVEEAPKPYNVTGKDTLTTASGLKYIVVSKGQQSAERAVSGSNVSVHYTGYLPDGKVFDSSIERADPLKFKLGAGRVIKGWDEGIALMQVGDKIRLIIPPNLAYGEQGAGGVIPPNTTLTFDVELVAIAESVKPYDISGKPTLTTNSGLKYIVVSKSDNPIKAEPTKKVTVHYTGFLSDGKIFDSSVERGEPIQFELGTGKVIPGWEEGIALMHVGDKLRLIIPPSLAYGAQGAGGVIPPNATLNFDVELIKVE